MIQKFLLLGWGRHGKDTLCEMMCRIGGLTFKPSSEFLSEKVVFPTMEDMYENWQECFADRHNHRAHWFNTISDYNGKDKARLAKAITAKYDIYCGLRNKEEVDAAKELFDLIIWIEDPRKPPEPLSSMTATREDADVVIYNEGTLEDLERKITKLLKLNQVKYL